MPYPEPPVESSLCELGGTLRAGIMRPGLREFLLRSLQIRDLECAFGLPRRLSARVQQGWLSAPHVYITLGSGTTFDRTCCEVALPPEQALDLIDRVLGASGRTLLPGRFGQPTAAERGVLAYFAARCARACDADLRVHDVRTDPAAFDPNEGVLWPVRVTGGDALKLDLKLIIPDAVSYPRDRVPVRLVLADTLDERVLPALEAGDLLTCDTWSLYATSSGPSGLLELSVAGSSERALVALEGDAIRLSQAVPSPHARDSAELVVARMSLEFAELARLMDGDSAACPPLEKASLEAQGQVLARGRLVRFESQLALEVDDYSTR